MPCRASPSAKASARARRVALVETGSVSSAALLAPRRASRSSRFSTSRALSEVTRSTAHALPSGPEIARSSRQMGTRAAVLAMSSSLPPVVLTTRPSTRASTSRSTASASRVGSFSEKEHMSV